MDISRQSTRFLSMIVPAILLSGSAVLRGQTRDENWKRCGGNDPDRAIEACSVLDRKSTRLNSSHQIISYAVFCLKKKNDNHQHMLDPSANEKVAVSGRRQRDGEYGC